MPSRAVWRPQWWAWALLGLASLALVPELAPGRLSGHGLILTPLLVLAGVLVLRWLWERPPAATMCAAIVLTIFSGAWRQVGLGGLPFDRLLIIVVLLQFVLRAPGIARLPRLQVRNVHLLMCLTIMYAAGSAAVAGTLVSETGFLALLDQFGVVPFAMFLLAPAIFSGDRERQLLLATLVGLGAYLGLTAIFESLGPHALVFPHYIVQVDSQLSGERTGGPFQASIAEGLATFSCAVAATMAFVQWRGQRKQLFAAVVAPLCLFGSFLTLERGVWLGAGAAIVVTAAATRTGRRWLPAGVVVAVLLAGAVLVAIPSLEHKASTRAHDATTVWAREDQISAGLRMLAAKPLLGFGWNRYESDSLEYFRESASYPMEGYALGGFGVPGKPLPLHETYLAYAVELGLVGALLWLATLLWGVGQALRGSASASLRPWKLGLLAVTTCFLVIGVVNPYQAPFPMLLLWVWAGVALGGVPQRVPRPSVALARAASCPT
ncbi:MAG TPA: O-antigen ligase family protein [Solirubrobacteraceae bacterium]|jgi:O-antigen ligase|nr:O-antigen ligase family protein [Solirubrobacteraceae bacterium]